MTDCTLQRSEQQGHVLLTEFEAKEILKKAGIPVVDTRLAKTKKEAVAISRELGFPVVLKIASPDIVHKSDAGGVRLGLANATRLSRAYSEITCSVKRKFPKSKIDGISVQKMARPGIEIIIGMSKDTQFGPLLMFGLGGIWVEILKDVSFRLVPVSKRDAEQMIKEIKGYPLLQGYRGQEPADINYLENLIVKVSDFIELHPEIKELDLNPVFAYKDGAIAVDARIILESEAES